MDHLFYKQQIERLRAQWPHAYSEERMVIIYNAFKDVSNFDFRDAVTDCIANSRSAPLLKELTEAVIKAKNNYFHQKRIDEGNLNNGMFGIENKGTADPEYVKKCIELFEARYVKKELSYEQYQQGCDLLDQAEKLYRNKNNRPTTIPPKKLNKPYKEGDDDEKPF